MDFVRRCSPASPDHLTDGGVLVLEIGHERATSSARSRAWSPGCRPAPATTRCCCHATRCCGHECRRNDHAAQRDAAPRLKVVLEQASLTLNPGERSASSAATAPASRRCSLLTGKLHADAGDCDIPARWRLAEVEQTMPETEDGATDFVLGRPAAVEAEAALTPPGDRRWARDGRRTTGAGRRRRVRRPAARQACCLGLGFRQASSTRR